VINRTRLARHEQMRFGAKFVFGLFYSLRLRGKHHGQRGVGVRIKGLFTPGACR